MEILKLLNNLCFKEILIIEIRKYVDLKNNENTKFKHTANKAVIYEKFITVKCLCGGKKVKNKSTSNISS